MTRELEALARHRLARSREALAEGEQLLRSGASTGAVNRFCYEKCARLLDRLIASTGKQVNEGNNGPHAFMLLSGHGRSGG